VRIPAWERENFRLNKGNIFPSRKSLVSDIPAGEGKTAKHFFTVYREIQSGALAKSYIRKGFLIYEEMGKYFPIYEEALSHI
jgi:hypothetical protein